MNDLKARFLSQAKLDIDAELAFLVDSPTVSPVNLESTAFNAPMPEDVTQALSRTELLIAPNGADWLVEVLTVEPQSEVLPVQPPGYRYWSPAVLKWHPAYDLTPAVSTLDGTRAFPNSVRMFGHPIRYGKSDLWVQKHPRMALREIFELGAKEDPSGIGLPYVIVHIPSSPGQHKSTWFQRESARPGMKKTNRILGW